MATSIGKNPYGGENDPYKMAYMERFNPEYFTQNFANLYPNGFPGPGSPAATPMSPQSVNTPPRVPSGGTMPVRPPGPGMVQPGVMPGRGSAAGNTGFAGGMTPSRQVAAAKGKGGGGRQELTPEQKAQRAAGRLFGPDSRPAGVLSDYFFGKGSLGRVGQETSPEMQGYLDRYSQMAGQYAGGGRTDAQQGAMNRFQTLADQYAGGGRSQDMSGVLGGYQNFLQGYSGQEGQAMREQAERGLNSQFQTGLRAQQGAARRNRLSGASQAAQVGDLAQQRLMAQSGIETDLAVRGADERRRALDSYNQALSAQESAEFGRQMSSAETYGNYLTGQEDREYGRMRDTQDAAADAQRQQEQSLLEREQFNLGQQAGEVAGRYGTYFGSMDVAQQRREAKRGNKLSRRALKAYERSLNTR